MVNIPLVAALPRCGLCTPPCARDLPLTLLFSVSPCLCGESQVNSGQGPSAAQRAVHAVLPLLQHPLSKLGKLRMLLRIAVDFSCGLLNRFCNALQNLPDLRRRAARPCLTKLPQLLCRWPFGRAVESQGQAVFGENL